VADLAGLDIDIEVCEDPNRSPGGKLPYFKHQSGAELFEPCAIIKYICREHTGVSTRHNHHAGCPNAGLMGESYYDQSICEQWIQWCQNEWLPQMNNTLNPLMNGTADPLQFNQDLEKLKELAKVIDNYLNGKQQYLVG